MALHPSPGAHPTTLLVLASPDGLGRSVAERVHGDLDALVAVEPCRDVVELCTRAERVPAPAAALLDGSDLDVDRDLLSALTRTGIGVAVVDHPDRHDRWRSLGASIVLRRGASPADVVLAIIAATAATTGHLPGSRAGSGPDGVVDVAAAEREGAPAPVVTVTGIADLAAQAAVHLARASATMPSSLQPVLLVDATLRGRLRLPLAVAPSQLGLRDLVAMHQRRDVRADEVAAVCRRTRAGAFHLLAGMRSADDWLLLHPEATAAALESARSRYRLVVVLVDDDLDDEATTGSVGIEDRNLLSRVAVAAADVLVVATSTSPWAARDRAAVLDRFRAPRPRGPARPDAQVLVVEVVREEEVCGGELFERMFSALGNVHERHRFTPPPPTPITIGELGTAGDR